MASNVIPTITAEARDAWRAREAARLGDGTGTYERLPYEWREQLWFTHGVKTWEEVAAKESLAQAAATEEKPYCWRDVQTVPYRDHFAHVSTTDGAMVAFTENDAKGVADRQTKMKPGKYLTKFFSDVLSAQEITDLATSFCAEFKPMVLQFAATADDIEHVYTNGPSSCMSEEASDYQGHCHPVRVYGDSDLRVAYIAAGEDDIKARAICWPTKLRYGRIYGDERRLKPLLDAAGYSQGSMRGAQIRRIECKNGEGLIMPYVDGISYGSDDGDGWITLGLGDISLSSTSGATENGPRYTCDHCGDRMDEEEVYYCEHDGETLCECCDNDQRFYCERLERTASGTRYDMVDGTTWCEVAFDRYGGTCAITDERHPADELLDMANGDTWCEAAFEEHGFTCCGTGERHARKNRIVLADGAQWCTEHFELWGYTVHGVTTRACDAPSDVVRYRCTETLELPLPDPVITLAECLPIRVVRAVSGWHVLREQASQVAA